MRVAILAAILALALGGCALLDGFWGVQPDGSRDPAAPAGTVGSILGAVIPGGAAILSGVGGIYAALRARAWRKALEVTASTIEEASLSPALAEPLKLVKGMLSSAHKDGGVQPLVDRVLEGLPLTK